jgi:hypothetical protein
MKKLLDVRHFVIIILILIAIVEFINPKGIMPHRVKIQTDSIPYAVHDTIPVDSLVEVEVEVEVPVEVPVEKRVEVPVLQPVDTNEILKIHFAKVYHKEVLNLPNNQGSVTIIDTISKNTIVNRKFIADVKRMIVKDTIYTKEPKKNQIFFGFESGFSSTDIVSHIGTGILFKTKEDKVFHIGVGVANRTLDGTNGSFTPYVDGGVYWKLKKRR